MRKAKLIYNPHSGDGLFKNNIDQLVSVLQEADIEVHLFRVAAYGDIEKCFKTMDIDYDIIIGSGGDGTINTIVTCMINNNVNAPLAIIPSGTANDFASFLEIPKSPSEVGKLIVNGHSAPVDIGKINDRYFINVVACGVFANISNDVDQELKNSIGKLAYYIKAVERIQKRRPVRLKITIDDKDEYEDDFMLVTVMNSSGAGGFSKVSPVSSVTDGKMDVVAFKATSDLQMAKAFMGVLSGDHIYNKHVLYVQGNNIKIDQLDDSDFNVDIDGEVGPLLPVDIQVLAGRINIFVNKQSL